MKRPASARTPAFVVCRSRQGAFFMTRADAPLLPETLRKRHVFVIRPADRFRQDGIPSNACAIPHLRLDTEETAVPHKIFPDRSSAHPAQACPSFQFCRSHKARSSLPPSYPRKSAPDCGEGDGIFLAATRKTFPAPFRQASGGPSCRSNASGARQERSPNSVRRNQRRNRTARRAPL